MKNSILHTYTQDHTSLVPRPSSPTSLFGTPLPLKFNIRRALERKAWEQGYNYTMYITVKFCSNKITVLSTTVQ